MKAASCIGHSRNVFLCRNIPIKNFPTQRGEGERGAPPAPLSPLCRSPPSPARRALGPCRDPRVVRSQGARWLPCARRGEPATPSNFSRAVKRRQSESVRVCLRLIWGAGLCPSSSPSFADSLPRACPAPPAAEDLPPCGPERRTPSARSGRPPRLRQPRTPGAESRAPRDGGHRAPAGPRRAGRDRRAGAPRGGPGRPQSAQRHRGAPAGSDRRLPPAPPELRGPLRARPGGELGPGEGEHPAAPEPGAARPGGEEGRQARQGRGLGGPLGARPARRAPARRLPGSGDPRPAGLSPPPGAPAGQRRPRGRRGHGPGAAAGLGPCGPEELSADCGKAPGFLRFRRWPCGLL